MAVVLADKAIDQAEAFRLSKAYRLGPDVALNTDPDVIRFGSFASAFRLDRYGLVLRAFRRKLDVGMAAAISQSASYTDRLSHFSDLDNPVVFEDIRAVLLDGASGPSSDVPDDPPYPSALPGDVAEGDGGDGGPSAFTPGPDVPGD